MTHPGLPLYSFASLVQLNAVRRSPFYLQERSALLIQQANQRRALAEEQRRILTESRRAAAAAAPGGSAAAGSSVVNTSPIDSLGGDRAALRELRLPSSLDGFQRDLQGGLQSSVQSSMRREATTVSGAERSRHSPMGRCESERRHHAPPPMPADATASPLSLSLAAQARGGGVSVCAGGVPMRAVEAAGVPLGGLAAPQPQWMARLAEDSCARALPDALHVEAARLRLQSAIDAVRRRKEGSRAKPSREVRSHSFKPPTHCLHPFFLAG